MTDLMYFGYPYEADSSSLEKEFMSAIKNDFAEVKFKNAYDDIKGYRQEIMLDDFDRDNYYAWVIAHGWAEMSLMVQLMMMDYKLKDEFFRLLDYAKQRYPHCFKPNSTPNVPVSD